MTSTVARRPAIVALGRRGTDLARRVRIQLGGDLYLPERFAAPDPAYPEHTASCFGPGELPSLLPQIFTRYRELILVLPLGVAVRLLGPVARDKETDPAVVVLDEAGKHAVAMLSGHEGGANDLARTVAGAIGASPVITTSSDIAGLPALDLLGREWGWSVERRDGLTRAAAALLDGEPIGVYQEAGEEDWWQGAPPNLQRYGTLDGLEGARVSARLVISDRLHAFDRPPDVLYRPRTLVAGVGCVRGATADEIEALLTETLRNAGLSDASLRALATIDVKKDEAGISELAARRALPLLFYSAAELSERGAPSGASDEVLRAVGAPGVCEPAALLAAGASDLVVPKTRTNRATVAVARIRGKRTWGRLTVAGIGPGAEEDITIRAREALLRASDVVGYRAYLDQVRPWLGEKSYHESPIGEEEARCRLAIELARAGREVAIVSSGDAGIYGMAGLVFELLAADGAPGEADRVEVVPGVSASQAAAGILGAPLMSDYAAISLSDLMTPWPVIERRLEAVAAADMVVALYNPTSARRRSQLERAREIILRHRPASTPVGIVRNATRPGQAVSIADLGTLLEHPIDMLTVLIVGNSATFVTGGRLVTRRGYLDSPAPPETDQQAAGVERR